MLQGGTNCRRLKLANGMSPFFLLDYHKPEVYTPTTRRRGVGTHPHRGFETVTIAYQGDIQHWAKSLKDVKLPKYEKWGNYANFLPMNVERMCYLANGN